ncbi:hypothetical protein O9X98_04550 [Agrobacterium salinitolerans]|nr:hypothetical protein [Agrobacterium salinitolerans]
MMPKEDAERYLASTAFSKVDLAETELMRSIYVHENDKITDLEKRVLDVTKANFAVFGAVALFSNTSLLMKAYGNIVTSFVALSVIGLVSLAASVYVVLIHKYIRVHHQKVSFLQRGVWRRRPLEWLEAKYVEADLGEQFHASARLGALEFLKHKYTMKTINLIPFIVALFGIAYISKSSMF